MNGGPAFPMARVTVLAEDGTPNEAVSLSHSGMDLRDYFAAKAMQGFAADDDPNWVDGLQGMARAAYAWADAMLAERAK